MSFAFKRTGDADYPRHLKILIIGNPKSGKALAHGTEVLTPSGWKVVEELRLGDHVVGADGQPTAVTGVFPQGERRLLSVSTDDGGNIVVDEDHLWTVRPHSRGAVTLTTTALLERIKRDTRYAYLPLPSPIHFAQSPALPIAPYSFGLLLGDGGLGDSTPKFHKPDLELHDALRAELPGITLVETAPGLNTWRLVDRSPGMHNWLLDELRTLKVNVLGFDKHIPEKYLSASISDRFALLQGLMDSDGGMNGKSACFYTSAPQLREDVVHLVRSLGGVATTRYKPEPKYVHKGETRTGAPAWNVSVRLPADFGCPFRLQRKANAWRSASVHKRPPSRRITRIVSAGTGEATCIKVEHADGLFVTQDFLVTHNTTFVSTAPNVVIAALPDAGLMSIAHKNVPYVDIPDVSELQTLLMVLTDPQLRAKAAAQLGLPQIETVAIDTLDNLQEIQKKEILRANKSTEMRQADWGKLKEHMAAIIKGFVALPMNVIFTVHATTMQDDEQRIIQVPALQGSIKDEIAGYVDFSLLAERKRELNLQGVPEIKYYLKTEGDQKNPHLGNRAAGRLPEYIEPDFKLLHDAVFSGLSNMLKTAEMVMDTTVTNQPVAQPASQADEGQQVTLGTPAPIADTDTPINKAGISALTKMFVSLDVPVPDFTHPVWTLEFARETAKMIQAFKGDEADGAGVVARDELIDWLNTFEVPGYRDVDVQTPVETVTEEPKPRKRAAKKVEPTAPAAEDTSVSVDAAVEAAVATATETLGATVMFEQASPGALCAECSKAVDDVDIANLALSRYRRVLCTPCYMAANRAQ